MDMNAFREQCGAYLLGALGEAERASFEAELARRGEEGQRALASEAELLGDLALVATPTPPPPGLRDRILAQVREEGGTGEGAGAGGAGTGGAGAPPSADAGRPRVRDLRIYLMAAAIAALALGIWNVDLRRTVAEQEVALDEAARGLAALDSLEAALRATRDDFETLAAPGTSVFSLAGTEDRPGARARVFVDPETGRALVLAYDLPLLSAAEVYQLWALRDGVPASVGTFAARDDGPARLALDSLDPVAEADLFAVTVEPAPGQPAPTGTMVLISGS